MIIRNTSALLYENTHYYRFTHRGRIIIQFKGLNVVGGIIVGLRVVARKNV